MLETTTTNTNTTAQLPALPMTDSLPPQNNSTPTSQQESTTSPDSTMPQFIPGQCLFCPKLSPCFTDSMTHMQKSHGLFVPHQQCLAVDLEALFRYLHLIIFGYRECIRCGTERATVQAVQQHMAGKGHCNFDTSEQDSEFAKFYDFSDGLEDDVRSETEDDGEETHQEEVAAASSARTPQAAGQDSIRLPSGRIISRQSPASTGPSSTQLRRRARAYASRLARTLIEDDGDKEEEKGAGQGEEPGPGASDTRLMSRKERRERETITYQMESMSASDRNSLVHLPPSQQRAILAAQFRHAVKVQKEERRRQGKVDRKGNKNLYAYWHTETPVYQCG